MPGLLILIGIILIVISKQHKRKQTMSNPTKTEWTPEMHSMLKTILTIGVGVIAIGYVINGGLSSNSEPSASQSVGSTINSSTPQNTDRHKLVRASMNSVQGISLALSYDQMCTRIPARVKTEIDAGYASLSPKEKEDVIGNIAVWAMQDLNDPSSRAKGCAEGRKFIDVYAGELQ